MEKLSKSARVAAIVKVLMDSPQQLITLGELAERFSVAKSSLSEDLAVIRQGLESQGLGRLETVAGASGGVRFVPGRSREHQERLVGDLCRRLSDPTRAVARGYIFLNDILYDPWLLNSLGEVIAGRYVGTEIDAVVTVETRGIPLALSVARHLNIGLVIARRETVFTGEGQAVPVTRQESFVTDGPVMSISYVSGSHRGIQSMSLPRRSLKLGSRVLIVDDYLRAGGTLKGLTDLLSEFGSTVVGTVVLAESATPDQKLICNYVSVVKLAENDGKLTATPGSLCKTADP